MHAHVCRKDIIFKKIRPTHVSLGPLAVILNFWGSQRRNDQIKKLFLQKLFRGSNNIGFELFPDQVCHFELSRRWWCCRLCGLVGGERVPLSPLGWYCVYLYPIPFNQYPCKLIAFSFCNANSKSNRETSYLAYRYKGMYFRDLKVCKMYVFMKKIGM